MVAGPWKAQGSIPEAAAEHKGWIQRAFDPFRPDQVKAAAATGVATRALITSLTQLEEDQDEQQGFFSGFEGLDWNGGSAGFRSPLLGR